MTTWFEAWLAALLAALALPKFGLSTVFVVSFISATLLPLASEPAVFGFVKLNPDLLWATIVVATVGNTLGGIVDYWMGYGAHRAIEKATTEHKGAKLTAMRWLERFGPKAMFLSFLPGVGDPLCAVGGWLKMPFWPCAGYMLLGKFLRYAIYTPLLLYVFPGQWHP
jgi:membrane protein YqaA with SNARE-associated domain